MISRRCISRLLLLPGAVAVAVAVHGQSYVTAVRADVTPPSASSAAAVQPPVPDLLTGAVDLQIPLYTVGQDGVSLPVSLHYHTGGIKVFDDPAPVGYGWSLSPAFRAVRTVLGRPDDLYPFIDRDPAEHDEPEAACFMCAVRGDAVSPRYPQRYDPEHDLFAFALPGKTLYRVLDMRGGTPVFVSAGDSEYSVEADAALQRITVTDPGGIKYVYGGACEVYHEPGGNAVRTAWALSEIVCGDASRMTLSWSLAPHPVARRRWSGGFSFMDSPDLHDWQNTPYDPAVFENDNAQQAVFARINETLDFLRLNAVHFNGGSVVFAYEDMTSGPALTAVEVRDNDGAAVRRFALSYEGNCGTLLKKIDGGEGLCHAFEYDTQYGIDPFDGVGLHAQDRWGFFNNRPAPSLTPKLRLKSYCSAEDTVGYYKEETGDADRSTDARAMQALILKKVTWPTGGHTSFEYEPHRFEPARLENGGQVHPDYDPYLSEGGGLRVTSVTTATGDSDPEPLCVQYRYGPARVRAVPSAATFVEVYDALLPHPDRQSYCPHAMTRMRQVNIMPLSDYMRHDHNAVQLWYDSVEQIWPQGKTVTEFADVIEEHDFAPVAGYGRRHAAHQCRAYGAGPVLTRRTFYESTPGGYAPVKSAVFSYSAVRGQTVLTSYNIERRILLLDTDPYYNPDIPDGKYPGPAGSGPVIEDGYQSRRYTLNPFGIRRDAMTVMHYTENGVISSLQRYEYKNGTQLVTAVTTVTSEGQTARTEIGYAANVNGGIEAQMASANVIGVPLKETLVAGAARTETLARYVRTAGGAFRQQCTATVFDSSADTLWSPCCEYDAAGKLMRATDADGLATGWAWDAQGLYPVSKTVGSLTTHYTHKPLVGPASVTVPWGMQTAYGYDPVGRLKKTSVAGLGDLQSFDYLYGVQGNAFVRTLWTDTDKARVMTGRYDNCGRLTKTLDHTTGVMQTMHYDGMGRCVRTSRPHTDGVPAAYDYALTSYRACPGTEVVSETKPGKAWHDNGRCVRHSVWTNTASGTLACPQYALVARGIVHKGNYAPGVLAISQTTDEDGHVVRTYVTKAGLTVMAEEGDGAADMLRTRMIYDGHGRLRAVLPPGVADGDMAFSDDRFTGHCHEFGYDALGRCTLVRAAGATAAHRTLYSAGGRVVAVHTPYMDEGRWLLHFYDADGRRVYTADENVTEAELAGFSRRLWVARYDGSGQCAGYAFSPAPPFAVENTYTAAYYDNYAFCNRPGAPSLPASAEDRPGLQTGAYKAVCNVTVGPAVPLSSPAADVLRLGYYDLTVYDLWGRTVKKSRQVSEGTLCDEYAYDRAGNVLQQTRTFSRGDTAAHVLVRRNDYDAAGRLTAWTAACGGGTASCRLEYGGDGLLAAETFGNGIERRYDRDCHGWLTRAQTIRQPYQHFDPAPGLSADGLSQGFYSGIGTGGTDTGAPGNGIGPLEPEVYTETVFYAEGRKPRYGGCASGYVSTLGGRYDYTFDCHDRLVAADYTPGAGNGPDEDFSARYAYDDDGALLSLRRHGINDMTHDAAGRPREAFGVLDDLEYRRDGARLCGVDCTPRGTDFFGRTGWCLSATGGGAVFARNAAGALCGDSAHGITDVQYNPDGQPEKITFGDGSYLTYAYDADGGLAGVDRYGAVSLGLPSLTVVRRTGWRRYCGAFVFENDSLAMVRFDGGYFDAAGRPHYLHTDRQGSVTMVTGPGGETVQHNGYYPYGEPWREPQGQPLLFAGKERLRDLGLTHSDFTARRLDTALALWTTPDPLAAKNTAHNPCAYCNANPVRFADPTGCDTVRVACNEGKWKIDKTSKAEGDDVFVVTQNDVSRNVVFAGGSYGKRLDFLDLEVGQTIRDLTLGVYHVSGTETSGFFFVPGGAKSSVPGSHASVPYGQYGLTGHETDNWAQPKLTGNGVDERGILIHQGWGTGQALKSWTKGCFVVCSDYSLVGGRYSVGYSDSKDACRLIDTSLGATKINEVPLRPGSPRNKVRAYFSDLNWMLFYNGL